MASFLLGQRTYEGAVCDYGKRDCPTFAALEWQIDRELKLIEKLNFEGIS